MSPFTHLCDPARAFPGKPIVETSATSEFSESSIFSGSNAAQHQEVVEDGKDSSSKLDISSGP